MLVEYNAVDSRLAFIPLPNEISIKQEGRTLSNVYAAQGGGKVISVIKDIVGVECDSYIKMDRACFVELVNVFGNVNYEVLKTVNIRDGAELVTLDVGTHRLDAETMFGLAMYGDYNEGESYKANCTGQMFADLINQNYRIVDSSSLNSYFDIIMNGAETDLTEEKFLAHRQALLYSVQYGVYPGNITFLTARPPRRTALSSRRTLSSLSSRRRDFCNARFTDRPVRISRYTRLVTADLTS